MASHTLLNRAVEPSLTLVPTSSSQIRRIFNNDQIIEKFDNWLLICGKSKNTRDSYTLAAKQLAKFIINKPLTAVTKEDASLRATQKYLRLATANLQATHAKYFPR